MSARALDETPIRARTLFALVILTPSIASAQAWTEADVASRAREDAPEVRAAAIRASADRARAETAGLLPNPELQWERQETFEPNAQEQDLVRLVVPLELGGRPWAQRELARVEAELSAADSARARDDAVEAALVLFYRALALHRRAELHAQALESIAEARRVIAAREAAGEAAGYDTARLALESELWRSRSSEVRIEAGAARAALGALLGTSPPEELAGQLGADAPPTLDALLEQARNRRDDVEALRRAERAAEGARSAAEWAWLPRIELTGGYDRQAQSGIEGHGYVFVVSAQIPIFDHGQAERARAAAIEGVVAEYREAMEQRMVAEVRAAREQLVGVLAERARYAEAVAEPLEVVVQAAMSGYREGERSVVELVDARRAATETAERQLALDLAARIADVRLRRLVGGYR